MIVDDVWRKQKCLFTWWFSCLCMRTSLVISSSWSLRRKSFTSISRCFLIVSIFSVSRARRANFGLLLSSRRGNEQEKKWVWVRDEDRGGREVRPSSSAMTGSVCSICCRGAARILRCSMILVMWRCSSMLLVFAWSIMSLMLVRLLWRSLNSLLEVMDGVFCSMVFNPWSRSLTCSATSWCWLFSSAIAENQTEWSGEDECATKGKMNVRCMAEARSLIKFGRAATAAQQSSSSRGRRRYSALSGTRSSWRQRMNVLEETASVSFDHDHDHHHHQWWSHSSSLVLFSVSSTISRKSFAFSSLYSDAARWVS